MSNGKKHESFIPFYNPKFARIELQAGRQEYDRELSSGLRPKAILVTGIPFARKPPSFERCSTKTQLHWPGFEIGELTILVNDEPAYKTPFTNDVQHYVHFLEQTGNFGGKRGVGIDFFDFRDQNWLIPLLSNDTNGEPATIKINIKFDKVLEENYDILVLTTPYEEVLLNSDTHRKLTSIVHMSPLFLEATILTKSPSGRKRRAETTRKTRRKVCKTEESKIAGKDENN